MSEEVKAPSRLGSARVGSAKNKENNEPVNRAQSARLSNENQVVEKVENIDPPPVKNATSNEVENKEQESLKLELNQLEETGEGENSQKTVRSQLNSARSVRSNKNESNEISEENQTEEHVTNRSSKNDEKKSARGTDENNDEEQKKERINSSKISSRSEAKQPSARN